MCRDDIEHPGESVAWGRWAITCNDPDFRGKGAQDSGDDYGPAPGADTLSVYWAARALRALPALRHLRVTMPRLPL